MHCQASCPCTPKRQATIIFALDLNFNGVSVAVFNTSSSAVIRVVARGPYAQLSGALEFQMVLKNSLQTHAKLAHRLLSRSLDIAVIEVNSNLDATRYEHIRLSPVLPPQHSQYPAQEDMARILTPGNSAQMRKI